MNSAAAETDATDRQFCWEQVLRVRPLFRLSHPYAPGELSGRLLPLHAWFAAVEEALSRASDESVSRMKLAWWQQQLGPDYATSAHPITRQLQQSGAIAPEAHEQALGLLATTFGRVDRPAPADEQALHSLCRSICLYPMRLELALQGDGDPGHAAQAAACAVNGLVQLLRESSRTQLNAYTWVPLNLLARFSLTRQDLQDARQVKRQINARSGSVCDLITYLCNLGLSWRRDGIVTDAGQAEEPVIDNPWRQRHRHWIIQTELNAGLLKKLRRSSLNRHGRAFSRTGPADAWHAWRLARRHTTGEGIS